MRKERAQGASAPAMGGTAGVIAKAYKKMTSTNAEALSDLLEDAAAAIPEGKGRHILLHECAKWR